HPTQKRRSVSGTPFSSTLRCSPIAHRAIGARRGFRLLLLALLPALFADLLSSLFARLFAGFLNRLLAHLRGFLCRGLLGSLLRRSLLGRLLCRSFLGRFFRRFL